MKVIYTTINDKNVLCRTGIKVIDYKVLLHVDMDYKEFMDKFRTINTLMEGI